MGRDLHYASLAKKAGKGPTTDAVSRTRPIFKPDGRVTGKMKAPKKVLALAAKQRNSTSMKLGAEPTGKSPRAIQRMMDTD